MRRAPPLLRIFAVGGLVLLAACVSPERRQLIRNGLAEDLALEDPGQPPTPPEFVRASKDEWVRMTSGEWLRGEVTALNQRQMLEFDSEELDDLSLDWENVAELHTKRLFTILLENRATVTGFLDVSPDVVYVTTAEGVRGFRRDDVQRIVTGSVRERDHWSGKLKLGFTGRRGNTDQTDNSLSFNATRRTANTRLDLSLDMLQSEQGGAETANNQRFVGDFNRYLTSRLFVTLFALEAFRDRFQNIDLRVVPSAGIGYTFVDEPGLEWRGTSGLGYRVTRFDSVQPGDDDTDEEGVLILGTGLAADVTEKIEFTGDYTVAVSLEDINRSQHNLSLQTSYDVWGDLDLEITFVWTRIGDPEPDSNGVTPEPDDFRLDVGLSWSF